MLIFKQLTLILIFLNPSWLLNFYIDKHEVYFFYSLSILFILLITYFLLKTQKKYIAIFEKLLFSLIIFIFLDFNFGFLKVSKIFGISSTILETIYPLFFLLIILLVIFKSIEENYNKIKKISIVLVITISFINLLSHIKTEENTILKKTDTSDIKVNENNIIIILDSFSSYISSDEHLNQKFSLEANKLRQFDFIIFENAFSKFYYTKNNVPSIFNFDTDSKNLINFRKSIYKNGRPSYTMIENNFLNKQKSKNNFILNHYLFDFCQAESDKIIECVTTGNNFNLSNLQFMGYSDSFILRSSYYVLIKTFNKKIFNPIFYEKKNLGKNIDIIEKSLLKKYDNYIFHLQSSHPPNILDSQCQIAENYTSSYLEEAICHFSVLEKLFLFMKRNELFDNYNIHILGDHGQRNFDDSDGIDNNELLSIFKTFYAYKGNNLKDNINSKSVISIQDLFKNLILKDSYDFNTKAFIFSSDNVKGFTEEITALDLKNIIISKN